MVFEQTAVIDALNHLHNGSGVKEADKYLEAFQKTPAAWQISGSLLSYSEMSVQVFAAQTLRQKILYDLKTLNQDQVTTLRDTLIQVLQTNKEKLLITQIILCLADLAVLMTSWPNPIQSMASILSNNLACLLDFYTKVAEEFSRPSKFDLSRTEFNARADIVLKNNSVKVLEHLSLVFRSPEYHLDVINCVYAWLVIPF